MDVVSLAFFFNYNSNFRSILQWEYPVSSGIIRLNIITVVYILL